MRSDKETVCPSTATVCKNHQTTRKTCWTLNLPPTRGTENERRVKEKVERRLMNACAQIRGFIVISDDVKALNFISHRAAAAFEDEKLQINIWPDSDEFDRRSITFKIWLLRLHLCWSRGTLPLSDLFTGLQCKVHLCRTSSKDLRSSDASPQDDEESFCDS